MRVLERLCPQTWWQWSVYAVMAALLVLNVALANMQALDAAPQPHRQHRATAAQTGPDADPSAGSLGLGTQAVPASR